MTTLPGDLVAELLARYPGASAGPPDWAYPLPPSIPFVGRGYAASAPRIAVFASAENLAHYECGRTPVPAFLAGEAAGNRHRLALASRDPGFFPFVHIGPVDDGSLLCAALCALQVHVDGGPLPTSPIDLLERLAVANVGKFSIRTDGAANRDYAGRAALLVASMPFFRADLDVLRPDILLLPRTMYRQRAVADVVRAAAPTALVLPIPQFNSRVVHTHLAKHAARADALRERLRGTPLAAWTAQLRGYATDTPYRFFVEIEDVVAAARASRGA